MKKIQLRAIIEILGRPPAHIVEGLNALTTRIKAEKGIKIIDETHHAPVLVKDSKDLYTTFMELTLEIDDLHTLYGFLFQYMPANIEILSPEKIELTNQDMNQASNHLVQRMHQYDAVTKRMISERDMALQKLYEVAPHLFKQQAQQPTISAVPQNEKPAEKSKPKKKPKKSKK